MSVAGGAGAQVGAVPGGGVCRRGADGVRGRLQRAGSAKRLRARAKEVPGGPQRGAAGGDLPVLQLLPCIYKHETTTRACNRATIAPPP
eukprot:6709821-Pyramimonas_sp.AAC.1